MPQVKEQKKFQKKSLDGLAVYIREEYERRKKARKDLEDRMDEVDRQLEMRPDVRYKRNKHGNEDAVKKWMPEIELPLQSGTLEVLCSDALRMMFPDHGGWFRAKAYADEQFLQTFSEGTSQIIGSEIDLPSVINNENVNDYVQGFTAHTISQFDYQRAWDLINAEAFKYSVGVGRMRMASKSVFKHSASVTYNESKLTPIIVPMPLRSVYLDDKSYNYMANGAIIGGAVITKESRKLADIILAAKNPKDNDYMSGGWLTANLANIEPKKGGFVDYIEYEGDIVLPESGINDDGENIFVPNVIVTVVCGKNSSGDQSQEVVRIQYTNTPFSSYITVPYHQEHIGSPYGTSPLLKGCPLQKVSSETLNRHMQAAILNTEPPLGYDKSDRFFNTHGGPRVYPGAQWPTNGKVEIYEIGDPAALMASYTALLSQYADVTGITAPRLGAQTVSHTTAYAKDQEIERGTSRTVDYVRSTLKGPVTQWIANSYYMAKEGIGGDTVLVYSEPLSSYVNVRKEYLPDTVCFEAYGSGGPADTIARQQQKLSAIMTAIQINQLAVQSGLAQPLNFDNIIRQVLREGGITDVDAFTTATVASGASGAPQMGEIGAGGGAPNAVPIALQGLQRLVQ